ncbi:hypothetical protein Alg130_10953 [Pyrenophora tritici-repentis]|nr:hypothetical protein Alg130_10953 [Pyrenophora tritici-repentis]
MAAQLAAYCRDFAQTCPPFASAVYGEALEVLEELMLLWRFDVVHDTKQYAEWAYASPILYEVVLAGELLYVVVEQGGAALAPEERLADKVKRVSTVVVRGIIKHEVTN